MKNASGGGWSRTQSPAFCRKPNDDKNVIVEFRAGAGDEAALFAEICRMYINTQRAAAELENRRPAPMKTGIGGFKDATLRSTEQARTPRMKYEARTAYSVCGNRGWRKNPYLNHDRGDHAGGGRRRSTDRPEAWITNSMYSCFKRPVSIRPTQQSV